LGSWGRGRCGYLAGHRSRIGLATGADQHQQRERDSDQQNSQHNRQWSHRFSFYRSMLAQAWDNPSEMNRTLYQWLEV
jgi:hypothetical protein